MKGRLFQRSFNTLCNVVCKRRKGALDFNTEPFDYYGFVRTSFPVEIGEAELLKYSYHALINCRMEAARYPRRESQFLYIWDTAAYRKFISITAEDDPLLQWGGDRLEQGRIYTTCAEAPEDEGWLPWCGEARPSKKEVEKVLCKYIGFEKIANELSTALADLVQGYTRMEISDVERKAVFVTGCEFLVSEVVRKPEIWLRFRKFMEDTGRETGGGAFDMIDVRQVYDCRTQPEELPFEDMMILETKKEIEEFRPSVFVSVDRLPLGLPDWYDEFPVNREFWKSLPDAELRPWDRKHKWFELHRPEERRLVFFCDNAAYEILSQELDKGRELGEWARRCLVAGKLYVRDWKCPNRRGLPRREEDLERRDVRGWKLLPWPAVDLEFAAECPALAKAAWPNLDYCFIVDRYLKEAVFVTGDPEIAAEVGNGELRNWLLRCRRQHLVHDVRQVYSCRSQPEAVLL